MAFIPSPASSGGGGGLIKTGYGGWGAPAKYVFISTHQGLFSMWNLDQDFNNIVPQMDQYGQNNPSQYINPHSGHMYYPTGNQNFGNQGSSAYGQHNSFMTQSQLSSGSNHPVMSASMLSVTGSPYAGHYSSGAMCDMINPPGVTAIWYNRMIFNSDHTDKSINYTMYGPVLRAKNIGLGKNANHDTEGHDASGTRRQNLSQLTGNLALTYTIDGSQNHNASYNNKLKKLLVFSNNGNNGNCNVTIYSGIDFDKNPSPKAAFEAAGVTKTPDFAISMSAQWSNSNNETKHNTYMILCNDGNVRVASWHQGSGFKTWRFTPPTDGAFVSPTYITAISGTTSYGSDHGSEFGTSMIQSTDGKTVCVMAPYYYYHAGCVALFLDKVNANSSIPNHQQSNTSDAYYFVPYRDDGFALFQGGNIYSSSSGGGYIKQRVVRRTSIETGAVDNIYKESTGSQFHLKFNQPATTNYPMLVPCTDFHSHPYNYGSRSETS